MFSKKGTGDFWVRQFSKVSQLNRVSSRLTVTAHMFWWGLMIAAWWVAQNNMPCGYIRVTVSTANKHCINVMHQVLGCQQWSADIYLHDSCYRILSQPSGLDCWTALSMWKQIFVNQIWAFSICGSRSETGWIFWKYGLSMKNVNRTVVHCDLYVTQDQHFLVQTCRQAGWRDTSDQKRYLG